MPVLLGNALLGLKWPLSRRRPPLLPSLGLIQMSSLAVPLVVPLLGLIRVVYIRPQLLQPPGLIHRTM